MVRAMPTLTVADRPACRAWAELEVLSQHAYQSLRDSGLLRADGSGEARALVDVYHRLRRAQLGFARELGMTPKSRAEIQGGGSSAPIDGVFERIEKAHAERHGTNDDGEV